MSKKRAHEITLAIWKNVFTEVYEGRLVYVKTTAITDQNNKPAWVNGIITYVNRENAWFLVEYGQSRIKKAYVFRDIGRNIMLKGYRISYIDTQDSVAS